MKSLLHAVATLVVVAGSALCLLVQLDRVGTALDTINARAGAATK